MHTDFLTNRCAVRIATKIGGAFSDLRLSSSSSVLQFCLSRRIYDTSKRKRHSSQLMHKDTELVEFCPISLLLEFFNRDSRGPTLQSAQPSAELQLELFLIRQSRLCRSCKPSKQYGCFQFFFSCSLSVLSWFLGSPPNSPESCSRAGSLAL